VVVRNLQELGEGLFFSLEVLAKFYTPPIRWRRILQESFDQGFASLPVIIATSTVTGMVLALQLVTTLNRFGAENKTPQVLALALVRELGPVLAALMYVGKAGGRMASEIGTMSVNEQIKALRVMAIDPINFLVVNRVIAGMICLPLLVTIFDLVGTLSGAAMMFLQDQLTVKHFITQLLEVIRLTDLLGGWLKALLFGLVVTLLCCFKGYQAKGGSAGVGRATTEAVAVSSILVILANLVMTKFNMMVID
jgi:phospholipid/cholesterol/gamma-HCH transport system permease protein